jgi:DNA-binding winged helix-turn-helix (wHTH) protein/Tol biopolymer transport system component
MEQAPSPPMLKFGPYLVDLTAGEIRKNSSRIRLQEKPLRVLALLAERQGQVVTREELKKRLWPEETFVDFETGLNTAVSKLRDALSDSAENPRYIETIPRRGYRFISPVENVPANGNGISSHPATIARAELASDSIDTNAAVVTPISAPSMVSGNRNKYVTWKILFLAGLVTLSLLAFVTFKFLSRHPAVNLQNMQITKLTDSGKTEFVSISPDGRYIVYVAAQAGHPSLRVRNVATKSDIQVLPPDVVAFVGLTFSPDSNYIYFVRSDKSTTDYNYLYVMPVLGGSAHLLISDIDSPVSFSPNGEKFAFMRGMPDTSRMEIRIANSDGTDNTLLASLSTINFYPSGAAWSPDGKTIMAPVLRTDQETKWALVAIDSADGTLRNLYSGPEWIGKPGWSPDGNSLIVPMGFLKENRTQLWVVSYPGGEKRRFTNDLSDYGTALELTKNGEMLVTQERKLNSHIWTLPQGDSSQAKQITWGETADTAIVPGPVGKLLVQSRRSDLVLINADGSQRTLLRSATRNYVTMATCGDRYLIFDSYEDNRVRLMRTDADGSNPVKLTDDLQDSADCSPDGTWLAYVAGTKLYRLPIDGGSPTVLVGPHDPGIVVISPDGQWIASTDQEPGPVPANKIVVIPATGGSPVHVFDVPVGGIYLRWSPDQKGLQYLLMRDGATNVWEQPLSVGAPHQVTYFTSGRIFDFSWTRDRKQLLLAKGDVTSDVVLISNFR